MPSHAAQKGARSAHAGQDDPNGRAGGARHDLTEEEHVAGPAQDVPRPRRRRRAVGPPGAQPSQEPDLALDEDVPVPPDDDERLLREVPPHHG